MLPNITDLFESLGTGSNFHYLLGASTYFVTSKRINFVLISISDSCYKRPLIFYHVLIIFHGNLPENKTKNLQINLKSPNWKINKSNCYLQQTCTTVSFITCNFWEKLKKDIPEKGYSWSHLKISTCQSIVLFISVYKEFWSNERKKMKNIRASHLSMTGKKFCMTYPDFSQLIICILNLLAKRKIFHCSAKRSIF